MAKEKKTNTIKIILIFTLVLIGLPLGVSTLVYYTNDTFEVAVNDYLRDAPGFIGTHFEKIPTDDEREKKISDLSQHYIELEPERAAEKLYIIKKDDEVLFNDIKDMMNSMSSNKTKEILASIRNLEIRDDMLVSVYGEMETEKENALDTEVERYESMETNLAIDEISSKIDSDPSFLSEIGKIMEGMDPNIASSILYYLGQEDRTLILSMVKENSRENINSLLAEKTFKENKLIDLADIYEAKDLETSFAEIGNTQGHTIDELATIYMNLTPKKAGEILFKSDDKEFVDSLLNGIRDQERLKGITDSKALKISRVFSYLTDYNNKIDELVEVYEKMEPDVLGDIVTNMLRKDNELSSFQIDTNELYRVSDASIIMDVLRKMNKSTVSDVLSNMSSIKAAELSRKLILN
ncbi:hypothetical protein [Sporosalibacterium faouarense]|uniref:hypothetical protein n=1 Tax=Sporosalibacterium faouarense TaxID=516123 RepID=UPI00141C381F|nr:hypothetical protein [Sporosalibacterium faouarense]MTI47991.1 hypothetical protein [Bacillota bacterium]